MLSLTRPASGLKLNQPSGIGMFTSKSKLIHLAGLILRLLALDSMSATSTVQRGMMPHSLGPKKDQLRPALEYPVLYHLVRNTALRPADSDDVQNQIQLFHSGAEGQAGGFPMSWQTPAWLTSATGSTFGQSAYESSSLRSSADEADMGSVQPSALQVQAEANHLSILLSWSRMPRNQDQTKRSAALANSVRCIASTAHLMLSRHFLTKSII